MEKQWTARTVCIGCMEKLGHGLVALLIFSCMVILLGQSEWDGYAVAHYGGTDGYAETGWVLSSRGEILEEQVSLPRFLELEKGREYRLSTVLTYDGSTDRAPYGFLYLHHMHCRVYLDGEEIFSYTPEDLPPDNHSKSPGNIYAALPLPRDCQGRVFEVRFTPPLDYGIDYELPNTRFGDYPTMAHSQFLNDLPHNIIGVLTAFLGVMAILFSSVALRGREYREGLFIGMFALTFSGYSLTECPFNNFMFSNPYYTYLVNYATFTLMPAAMMAYMGEKFQKPGQQRWCRSLSALGLVIMGIQWTLHFTGILDMREFLKVIHVYYFASLLVLLVLVIRMESSWSKRMLLIQLTPIVAGMVLDGATYYLHWDVANNDAAFSSVGVVLFLLLELRHVWRSSIDIYTESIRSRYYQEMAYEDKLTGVGNRRAFDAEKMEIVSGQKSHRSIIVASADVNDLKQTNDTLGHGEGDYLIQSTAKVLSGIAEGCGRAFRVGGDEFLLILYDITEEELEQRVEQARKMTFQLNQSGHAFLSIAFGYETVEGLDVESAVQKADRKMYIDKGHKKEYRAQQMKRLAEEQ